MPSLTSRDLHIRNVTPHPRQPSVLGEELEERRLSTSGLSTASGCWQQEPQNKTHGLEVSNTLTSITLIVLSGYMLAVWEGEGITMLPFQYAEFCSYLWTHQERASGHPGKLEAPDPQCACMHEHL